MRKKTLLVLLMAAVLLLSGCELIKKDQAVDDATPILTLGDQVINKKQFLAEQEYQMAYMASYYRMFGQALDYTNPAVMEAVRNAAADTLKQNLAIEAKAAELGLNVLTEEEEARAQENAKSTYESACEEFKSEFFADTTLEGDALEEAVAAKMDETISEALGKATASMDYYVDGARKNLINDKVREYIIRDVAVTDEEIQADFDSKVAADQEKYAENAGSYATAANNGTTTLYWTPAGVRRVKQILIKFKDEDSKAISDAQAKVKSANGSIEAAQLVVDDEAADAEAKEAAKTSLETAKAELEAAQAELDAAKKAAFANIDADADAVVEALANGEDWAKLAEEKNEDPGMKAGAPTAETGYAVAAGMTSFDAAFVDAAMALEKVGDVSGKVASDTYGYYIIRYESDVQEGAVALDTVKDSIHDTLLSSRQNETYQATVDEWVKAAGIKEDLGALNN